MVEPRSDGEVLTIFVADGAGSAAKGLEGAATAVQTAVSYLAAAMRGPGFELTESLAPACLEAVRTAIDGQAATDALQARDYACTFLGLVSSKEKTLAFQIGDGAIVLDVGAGLELTAPPMTGEYANMTHFVTQPDYLEVMAQKIYQGRTQRAAVFSDGIQRLALNMAQGTPHEPFFTPFFDVLAKATAQQEDMLQSQLAAFLASPQVNERTDDDKSLALAVWVE